MGEEQKIFSDGQKEVIYDKMLKPIKVKISEILLYDTESAMKFLQMYNDILKCTNEQEILSMITELELQIDIYERNEGLQKSFEDKSQALIQQMKDMQIDGDRISLEDFKEEFKRVKQIYQATFQKYSFQEKEKIDQQMYALYGKLLLRSVDEENEEGIEIPEEDRNGLSIFLNNEIGVLSQNANPQVQNAVERMKFKLMDKETAFQDDEIWKLLNYARSQKVMTTKETTKMSDQAQVTALAVVKEKKGLISRIKRKFQKEPQLPLEVDDLSKITVDWLAEHIPEGMLRKIEEKRLKEEGKNPKAEYLPDAKAAIYDFLAQLDNDEMFESFFEYEDKNGNRHEIDFYKYNLMEYVPLYLDEANRKRMSKSIYVKNIRDTEDIMKYSVFLDNIFGTKFANELASDYGEFIQNPKATFSTRLSMEELTTKDFSAKSRIYKELLKGYNGIVEQCKKNEVTFRQTEETQRRTFYEKSKFREEMEYQPDNENSSTVSKDVHRGTTEIGESGR